MTQPIRVLMLVRLFFPWIGGTERQAYKLARSLAERNISVQIVTGWWFRGTPQREEMDGIPVFRNQTLWEFFGIKGLRKFGGYLYILTLLWHLWRRRHEYDVIHVHGLSYHTFTAVLAGKWFGRKTIAKLANSGRASDIDKMRGDRQLMFTRWMLPTALQCDRFVAINKDIVAELSAAGVPADRIVRLTNGVEVDQIRAKTDYALHSPPRIVFVGRLHEQKGLDTLLRAFKLLLDRMPQDKPCLQLVGDGPLRSELAALAQRLGIEKQVEFVGLTDRVMDYLQRADIFVLPSRAEGISNALLEAMACALPVIVSKIPGNIDVVEDGKSGLWIEPDSAESLATGLATLLEQGDLRSALGATARQVVVDRYSMDAVADQYIALYQELLCDESVPGLRRGERSSQPPMMEMNEVHHV